MNILPLEKRLNKLNNLIIKDKAFYKEGPELERRLKAYDKEIKKIKIKIKNKVRAFKEWLNYDNNKSFRVIEYKREIYKRGETFDNFHHVVEREKEKKAREKKEKITNYKREIFEKVPSFLNYLREKYTTKFKFKKFVYNYLNINLFLYEMLFFYKYNIYLGFSKSLTNHRNGHYLLGYYNKVALIDLKALCVNFRANVSVITKLYLKKFMSGYVVNEIYNDLMAKGYMHIYEYFELGYFFGNWWKGFLRNFKIFIQHPSIAYQEFNFYKDRYPGVIYFLGVPGLGPHTSLYYLNQEVCRLRMFSMMFFDTKHSSQSIIWPLLTNNKTYYYNLFYIKIITCICMRVNFLKKKTFLNSSINLNLDFKYLLNKKNLFKENFYSKMYSDYIFLILKKKKNWY